MIRRTLDRLRGRMGSFCRTCGQMRYPGDPADWQNHKNC